MPIVSLKALSRRPMPQLFACLPQQIYLTIFIDFILRLMLRIHVARPGYMFPGDMTLCPGVNAA